MKQRRKRIVLVVVLLALAALLVLALRPQPLPVDLAQVRRGELLVTVEADGRTQVREPRRLLAPLSGHLERIGLRAGDKVTAGQVLAQIRPAAAPLLDLRTRAEAQARQAALEAARREASAAVERARIAHQRARRDLERARSLSGSGAMPRQELERAEFAEELRAREVRAAELGAETARRNVELARAMAIGPEALKPGTGSRVPVIAPEAATVLRVHRDQEGPIQAGAPLIELGDPADLEVVVELLTSEAVRVRAGAAARLEGWGGEPLPARVRLVEPSAFTKVSPLGVEEQRVNVRLDLPAAPVRLASLGDGYHVRATITVDQAAGVLLAPSAALFRDQSHWAAYVVEKGRAVRRQVVAGRRGGGQTEIKSGLSEGTSLVLYPDDTIREGLRVAVR